jgi:competence protein ComGC
MRLCPFCKERIQEEAIKCKHCGEFITKQDAAKISQYKFPKIWPGYVLGILFFIIEVIEAIYNPQASQEKYSWWTILFWLTGLVYWCICVYKLHKTILKITNSDYPITPAQAVGYGFIPFYNLYWIFKWPSEVINMVNARIGTKKFRPWVPGVYLFLFIVSGRVDGTIWLIGTFAVLSFLIKRVKISLTIQPEPVSYSDKITPISRGVKIAITCAVAIPVLALLAAIAIPNLLRARLNVNEASAIAILKEYHKQQQDYKKQNYTYKNVTELEKNGYHFKVSSLTDYTYAIKAEPVSPGVSGVRVFSVDETGVITTADGKVVEYLQK